MRSTLGRKALVLGALVVGALCLGCASSGTERNTTDASFVAIQKDEGTRPEAANGAQHDESGATVLGKLRMRHATLHILSGERFTVTSPEGRVIAENIGAGELAEQHEALADAYRESYASFDASVDRRLLDNRAGEPRAPYLDASGVE
jgi:hypothetical protein